MDTKLLLSILLISVPLARTYAPKPAGIPLHANDAQHPSEDVFDEYQGAANHAVHATGLCPDNQIPQKWFNNGFSGGTCAEGGGGCSKRKAKCLQKGMDKCFCAYECGCTAATCNCNAPPPPSTPAPTPTATPEPVVTVPGRPVPTSSALSLPDHIASHMVLQRGPTSARLWGFNEGGNVVTVTLDSATTVEAVTGEDGMWTVELPPQPASDGHVISVTDGLKSVSLTDIAFGDVFHCSGQSNMEYNLNGAFDTEAERADSIEYPNLRLAMAGKVKATSENSNVPPRGSYNWIRSSPEAFEPKCPGKKCNKLDRVTPFSATCYFFGRELYKAHKGTVPIGLIATPWGGQRLECFSSADALSDDTCGGTALAGTPLNAFPSDGYGECAEVPQSPNGAVYNGVLYPLLKMRLAGFIWYQGEGNSFDPVPYSCLFPAMLADFRVKTGQPDLPILFVQLAPLEINMRKRLPLNHVNWAYIRAAQDNALLLPGVGRVAAIDLGDPPSPYATVHPRRKFEIGRRLMLKARELGMSDGMPGSAPVLTGGPDKTAVNLDSTLTGATRATVSFASNTSSGLHFHDTAGCTSCCSGGSPLEAMDASGTWTRLPTSAVTLDAATSKLMVDAGDAISGLRLEWEGYPQCALYNGAGGPDSHTAIVAAPFQWCLRGTVGGKGPWEASCA